MKKLFVALLLSGSAQVAAAGVLIMDNGDRFTGSLKQIGDGKVTWTSEHAGEIKVPQNKVRGIVTEGYFHVQADERRQFDACFQLPNRNLPEFQCAQGQADLPSWASIKGMGSQSEDAANKFLVDGDVGFSGVKTGGKTKGQTLEFVTNVRARYRDQRHILNLGALRDQSENEIIIDERKANYRLDKFFSEKWFYSGTLGWKRDRFADLMDRYDIGIGIGYQFWDTNEGSLMVQVSPFYRMDHFIVEEDRNSGWVAVRTEYLKRLPAWNWEFFHNNSVSQSADLSGDFEVETETGINVPLSNGLAMRARYDYNFDGRPSITSNKDDSKFVIGLNYDW